MRKLSFFWVATATLSVLAGCNEDKSSSSAEVVQTVQWYKDHKAERDNVLKRCMDNPGELAATPNCVNASRADSSSTWGARGGGIKPIKPLTADDIKNK